jgi:hypothetical protein
LNNLVESLEERDIGKELCNAEVLMFTGNFTAEFVFYAGNSSSNLDFWILEGSIKLNVIHVPGSRMIQQGTDGLSRGDSSAGVLAGQDLLCFSDSNRKVTLTKKGEGVNVSGSAWAINSFWMVWTRAWIPGKKTDDAGLVMPEETGERWMLWVPPQAAAEVAVEELGYSRHKQNFINHVFMVPHLMTFAWCKHLHKAYDIIF